MVRQKTGRDHLENVLVYLILVVEWKACWESARCKQNWECHRCDEYRKHWHLGCLGYISLDKKGHGSVRIAKNRGLEKVALIQHKMIN